jgi:tRNA threonylcarbamoyladenosine biosynthesis protein TsaB
MKILAIDTSSEACSAALLIDGDVNQHFEVAPREHSKLILPMIESLLNEAGITLRQLDSLAFGRGPGSFTGIRVATGVIQGIALGAGLPVVPVSTLAAMAQGRHREHGDTKILTALDARMDEVYWCQYRISEQGLAEAMTDEVVCAPGQVSIPLDQQWVAIGSGWNTYSEQLIPLLDKHVELIEPDRYPQSHDIAVLAVEGFEKGEAVPAEQALPVYLRDQVAWKKKGSG